LPGGIFASAAYVGSKGTHLSKRFDQNVAPLPALNDTRTLTERRPYPQFNFILNDKDSANSWYHGLQLSARKAYSHGLVGQASYTWSKCLDQDSYDSKATRNYRLEDLDKGRCIHDFRQRFVYSMVYELPFGRNLKGAVKHVVSGWQLNSIVALQTGGQFGVVTSTDFSDTGARFSRRPNRICDGSLPAGQRNRDRWFDTSCFTLPAFRTYGNAGANFMDGPPFHSIDMSMSKTFRFTESTNMQFRAEAFNVPNLTNLTNPNNNVQSVNFGRISGAREARQIQFGLKLNF
jgi:hypothetical protein